MWNEICLFNWIKCGVINPSNKPLRALEESDLPEIEQLTWPPLHEHCKKKAAEQRLGLNNLSSITSGALHKSSYDVSAEEQMD